MILLIGLIMSISYMQYSYLSKQISFLIFIEKEYMSNPYHLNQNLQENQKKRKSAHTPSQSYGNQSYATNHSALNIAIPLPPSQSSLLNNQKNGYNAPTFLSNHQPSNHGNSGNSMTLTGGSSIGGQDAYKSPQVVPQFSMNVQPPTSRHAKKTGKGLTNQGANDVLLDLERVKERNLQTDYLQGGKQEEKPDKKRIIEEKIEMKNELPPFWNQNQNQHQIDKEMKSHVLNGLNQTLLTHTNKVTNEKNNIGQANGNGGINLPSHALPSNNLMFGLGNSKKEASNMIESSENKEEPIINRRYYSLTGIKNDQPLNQTNVDTAKSILEKVEEIQLKEVNRNPKIQTNPFVKYQPGNSGVTPKQMVGPFAKANTNSNSLPTNSSQNPIFIHHANNLQNQQKQQSQQNPQNQFFQANQLNQANSMASNPSGQYNLQFNYNQSNQANQAFNQNTQLHPIFNQASQSNPNTNQGIGQPSNQNMWGSSNQSMWGPSTQNNINMVPQYQHQPQYYQNNQQYFQQFTQPYSQNMPSSNNAGPGTNGISNSINFNQNIAPYKQCDLFGNPIPSQITAISAQPTAYSFFQFPQFLQTYNEKSNPNPLFDPIKTQKGTFNNPYASLENNANLTSNPQENQSKFEEAYRYNRKYNAECNNIKEKSSATIFNESMQELNKTKQLQQMMFTFKGAKPETIFVGKSDRNIFELSNDHKLYLENDNAAAEAYEAVKENTIGEVLTEAKNNLKETYDSLETIVKSTVDHIMQREAYLMHIQKNKELQGLLSRTSVRKIKVELDKFEKKQEEIQAIIQTMEENYETETQDYNITNDYRMLYEAKQECKEVQSLINENDQIAEKSNNPEEKSHQEILLLYECINNLHSTINEMDQKIDIYLCPKANPKQVSL